MIWNSIKKIDNFVNYNITDWGKALELGYLVFFPNANHFRILSTEDFNICVDKVFTGNNSFYYIIDGDLFINIDSQLYSFDFELRSEKLVCETKEERIKPLNRSYSLGSTHSRKPRVNRNEIISNADCVTVYSWDNKSYIVGQLKDSVFLFQSFEDDKLFCFDVEIGERIWSKEFNTRIEPGRLYITCEGKIITQESNVNGATTDLVCIEAESGTILWKVENALSFYHLEESNFKLYGIGGNTFEVINIDTGKRQAEHQLRKDLHITSRLTCLSNGLLYFSGYRDTKIPVFGAINVENGELVFTQEVEIPGEKSFRRGLDRPVVIGNRLYVIDAIKTLHVYERDAYPA